MKKIIYLIVIIGTLFVGCNPLNDVFDAIDAKEDAIVGDDNITLTADDYTDLGLDFENFSSVNEAKTLLPPFLGEKYPFWGQGSSVIVNFNLFDGNPEEAGDFVNADFYQLATEDYPTAASNAFFPNEDPSDFLENVLDTQIASPTEGQVVRTQFKQFTEEPVIGLAPIVEYDFADSFEGWTIHEEFGGNDVWTSRTDVIQGNGFFGGQIANIEWLISPEIDLTNESDLRFQISQAIRFAGDISLVKILVKTDWDGSTLDSNTWDLITLATTPVGDSDTQILSEDFDFSAYDGQTINIAFKYESTDSDAARWRIASLVLKTIGISGNTVTESVFYTYAGGNWGAVNDARYLSAGDYDSMGTASGQPGRFNNFSSSVLPENYLPTFLDINYPFAQEEDELFIIYRFFMGGSFGTVTKGNLYTVTNGNWTPSISTLQFGFDNGTWVPDNTIKYTLVGADYSAIVTALSSQYPDATSSMANFGNFDRRVGNTAEWTDAMVVEAIGVVLNNLAPSAADGQKYLVTFDIFNGSSGTESFAVIKIGGAWVSQ